jgi:hypothetical protein
MDDPDLGVTLSVTSLIMALVQDNADAYQGSYVKAAHRLKRVVVDNEYTADYVYYKVPCPWIQVKLLRLLQYYPPSGMWGLFLQLVYRSSNIGRRHQCSKHDSGIFTAYLRYRFRCT